MKPVLIYIRPLDQAAGARVDVRIGDGLSAEEYGTGAVPWQPAMITRPTLSIELMSVDMDGTVQAGKASFEINVRALRGIASPELLYWKGAQVIIYSSGVLEGPTAVPDFWGYITGGTPDRDTGRLKLTAEVSTAFIDQNLLTLEFSGGGGALGDPTKRGVLKPAGFGAVLNIEPVWFDLERYIGQIDGYGNTQSINWLGEGLSSFGPPVSDYVSYAALAAAIDNHAIPPGRWGSCVAEGMVGLGAPPVGIITTHASFGSNRIGAMMKRMLRAHANVAIDRIDSAAFDQLDTLVPRPVHYWTAEQVNVKERCEALAASCNATPLVTFQNKVTVTRATASDAVATLDRSGSVKPRVLNWATADVDPPFAQLKARTARPALVLSFDQVNYNDTIVDRGLYYSTTVYRQGNVVYLPNGSKWLFINPIASADHAPPAPPATDDEYWQMLLPPTTAENITYADGTPIEELKPAAPGADVTGDNTSKDTAAVGGVPVAAVLATLDKIIPIELRFDPIELDISALELAKVGSDAALAALSRATVDQDAVLRQIERDAGKLDETLLRLLSENNRTRTVLRDAGIIVDPATGLIRIYAVDQLADRTSRAEIAIDGVKATVTTKASVDYVDNQIALAVLDPAQAAQLEPIIARLTSAEQTIDGLNATVLLKAEALELTRVSGVVTTVQQDLDALAGTVSTKAEKTVVDALGIRTGSVEQTLSTLGNVSGISTTIRQARSVADDAATATLQGLLAGDSADRRRIIAQSEIRQELYAKINSDVSAEAVARTLLSVKIGDLDARSVQETTLRIAVDKVLGERIDSLSILSDQQAATIATLTQASIGAGVGIAGIQTTIRQQSRDGDQSAEALLGSLIAGDRASLRRAAQLVQIQSEFTTTLVTNEAASAVARQSLLARMGVAEAAIVTTSKVLADTTQALTTRITAAEAVFNDAGTGLAATLARLVREEGLRASGDEANAFEISALSAQLYAPGGSIPAANARIDTERDARVAADSANARDTEVLTAELHDPATGLSATRATVATNKQAQVDGDRANATSVEQVTARLDGAGGTGVTVEQSLSATATRLGVVEGRYTVSIDVNGNLVGFQLIGSGSGPGSLNLVNTDLRMGTGRVTFDNGTYMQVQGVAFGVSRDLLEWFGPTMAISQCSRANAISFKTITGDAYFGGSLTSSTLRNVGGSSGLSTSETAVVGPFGSNGKPIKYIASWSYTTARRVSYPATNQGISQYNAAALDADAPSDGTGGNFGVKNRPVGSSTIVLSVAVSGGGYTELAQQTFSTQATTFVGSPPTIGDAPGFADISTTIGGGFTVNDPVQLAANRTVMLALTRGFTGSGDSVSQRLSIVSAEE